jgi:hypothetical protein
VTTALVTVCKCGSPAHASDPARCAKGHNRVGVAGPALFTGEQSATFWQAAEHVRRETVAAVLADRGHTEEDAPRALVIAASGLAQAALMRDANFERVVAAGGPLTATERARRAFSAWLQACDRTEKYLRLVGLHRVPRPVDPHEAVRRAVEEANR